MAILGIRVPLIDPRNPVAMIGSAEIGGIRVP
jgi:hypothetical protein